MDYLPRSIDPYINHFIQPDSIIPNPANSQSWNRFSYVENDPIKFTDPSGHMLIEGAGFGGGGLPDPIDHPDEDDEEDDPVCHTWRPCDVETNLYEVGWENFGQAWSIYWDPNATIFQRAGAGYYMGVWGGAHAGLVVGGTILVWEAIVPGSMSCVMNPACEQKAAPTIESLIQGAKELYPKLADKPNQLHHIFPKYLGGSPTGPTVSLNPAYHQLITNEFRALWAYGQGVPSIERAQQIIQQVYNKFPLP